MVEDSFELECFTLLYLVLHIIATQTIDNLVPYAIFNIYILLEEIVLMVNIQRLTKNSLNYTNTLTI